MGKQLDAFDVGVGIDQPPGDQRTRVRPFLGCGRDPDSDIANIERIGHQPDPQRQRQPPVYLTHDDHRTDDISHRIPQPFERHVDRVFQRVAQLHDAVRQPTGKVVLKEIGRLTQQMLVRAPPDLLGHVTRHGLFQKQVVEHDDQRAQADDEDHREDQLEPVVIPERTWSRCIHKVDDPTGVKDQSRLHQSHDNAGKGHHRQDPTERCDLGFHIGPQPFGRRGGVKGLKRVDEVFESAEHGEASD